MAGIGFELKKLFTNKTASGYLRAYYYTAVVTVGPFVLVSGMVMAIQGLLAFFDAPYSTGQFFLASVVYCFVFSQLVSSGFIMLITRFVSDQLYLKRYDDILPSLYGIIVLTLAVGAVPAVWFLADAPFGLEIKLASFALYMLLIVVWIENVYLSAVRDYLQIVKAYAWGAITAVGAAAVLIRFPVVSPEFGTLAAMGGGAFVIAALLLANIMGFFRTTSNRHFLFISYFGEYFSLFVISLAYTLGVYIHNFFVWTGPLGVMIADTYTYAPAYDTATFYAFISVIPSAVFFIVSTEVNFYEKYAAYFVEITQRGNYAQVAEARKNMLDMLWSETRNIMEFQLVFTMLFLGLGNFLLPKVGFTYSALSAYNLLVLGAFANGLMQSMIIMLLYFDDRKGAAGISLAYLGLNTLCSYAVVLLGENFYGFGLFVAAFICLCGALLRLHYYSSHIDYFIFCTRPVLNNAKPGLLARLTARLYPS
jgi:uncharacterized membrane protein